MHLRPQGDREALIELDESFDFRCIPAFRRCFESLDRARLDSLIIDFRRTRYLDSAALGMLLSLRAHLQPQPVPITLARLSGHLHTMVCAVRFDKLFLIER